MACIHNRLGVIVIWGDMRRALIYLSFTFQLLMIKIFVSCLIVLEEIPSHGGGRIVLWHVHMAYFLVRFKFCEALLSTAGDLPGYLE
mgnify:CR=1 FL=1